MTTLAAPLAYLNASAVTPVDDRSASPWSLDDIGDERRSRRSNFAERCAAMVIELRTALEDRLPRLAAMAACWFEGDDADEEEDVADALADRSTDIVSLRIHLPALAEGLVRRDGQSATAADAEAFLTAVGFRRFGDIWVGDRQDLRLIGVRHA